MQQTILAIGALLIIMTTAMIAQRSSIITQEMAFIRHIEIAAEDAARMRLEGLSTLAFDESTVGATSIPTTTAGLTLPGSFGSDAGDVTPDDLDDFHGRIDTFFHVVSTDSFAFRASYWVHYLTPAGDSTATPTFSKELILNITSLAQIGSRSVNGVFYENHSCY